MQLAIVRALGSKCGSRKNSVKPSECIFFISPQTRIAPRKIGFGYDEWMSGQTIYAYVGGNPISFTDPDGLVKIPGISGAVGETSVHANPGPDATDFRPEHAPDHVHLGRNDGPRVRTSDFKPLSPEDAKKMSRNQKQFCDGLSEASKDAIRKGQRSIFKHGRVVLQIGGGVTSIAAGCRADPVWCAEQIEAGILP